MAIAQRHIAAVAALELTGTESVLEIGCGHGVALRMVLDRLTTGHVTALDRSQTMIDRVRGTDDARLSTMAVALEDADFAGQRFDRVYAINVDLNLRLDEGWPGMIRDLLALGGLFVLVFEPPPGSDKAAGFVALSTKRLSAAGFDCTVIGAADGIAVIKAALT